VITIAGVPIGPGQPCRFVAEISNNHNRSLDLAVRLLDAAKEAGADFAKVQCYTPEELVALRGDGPAPEPWGSQGWDMYRLYDFAKTPLEWFPELFRHAADIGLPLFSSVFGLESLALCEQLGCPAYKIARLDNQHAFLHDACLATRKPLIVSASEPRTRGNLTLWCPPGYPQNPADLTYYAVERGEYDGFSYHGNDEWEGVRAAVCGARMVEAHLQLSDAPSVLEETVSLTEIQFAAMISRVRDTEQQRIMRAVQRSERCN